MTMNFEGFQDLMRRIARAWYERAKAEVRLKLLDFCNYDFDHPSRSLR